MITQLELNIVKLKAETQLYLFYIISATTMIANKILYITLVAVLGSV